MKRGLIIICVLVFGLTGCKDFLNLVPKNKKVVANLEDVKTELLTYLASITYSTGGISPSYGGSVFRFPLYNDVVTQLCLYEDDIDMSHYSDHSTINEKAVNVYMECIDWKGLSLANVLWEKCYGAIGFLNVILDDLEKAGGYTRTEYETITGEVKTIRAYYIFKLLQFFAPYNNDNLGIPLNLDSENVIPGGRLSQREVYRIIIRELEEVLEYKAVREKWNMFYYPGIVKAILAQVYMYKATSAAAEESDWANAEKYSGELIVNYEPENREDVLAGIFAGNVREYQVGSTNYQFRMTYRKSSDFGDIFSGIWAEGKAQRVSNDLLGMYDETDIRRGAWFKMEEEEGRTIYYINKPGYTRSINEITVLFRTAEMYLINAEAKCRQNQTQEAQEMLENFKRARIPDFEGFSGVDVLEEILNERRKEFCYEVGTRWLDMKRLGIETSRVGMSKEGEGTKVYELKSDDYRYALPIPDGIELDYNNKVEQNPGWGNLN
ncbi:MAG TPA: RagB/SusD family nutrient uptake outer membrane protein [Candidatus Butyricimonas faecavium]|nr:RagB/SusD family nutrient uptake outer membrane protein [Candidatus Butyricimonas faecavium]